MARDKPRRLQRDAVHLPRWAHRSATCLQPRPERIPARLPAALRAKAAGAHRGGEVETARELRALIAAVSAVRREGAPHL